MTLKEHNARTSRWQIWLLLILVAAVGVYFTYSFNQHTAKHDETKADKKAKGIPSVTAEAVTLADVPVYLNGLGTVTGLRTVTVKSRIDGELMRVLYQEGAMVKAGEVLADIDPRPMQIQLMQMEGQLQRDMALLNNAQLDLTRYKTLLAQDSIAAQQVATQAALVAQYQGTVATDKALVENAKLQLSYTKITAPISGRLGLRLIDQGNMIKAADATGLAVITQVQPIAVLFTLPEDALATLLPALNAHKALRVEAFNRDAHQKLAEGTVLALDNQIDANTGTIKIKSQFANSDGALFVNQFVNIRLLTDTLHSVPIIASSAVQIGEKGRFVYVLKADQTVSVRPVKLGTVQNDNVVVLEGLTADELVVIDGTDKLRDGAKVKRVDNTPVAPTQDLKATQVKKP